MILAGCRSSPLSRVQFNEVQQMVGGSLLEPVWVDTIGDKDQNTSLRELEKTDFFTRELDQMLLNKTIRIAIHSAKDLPEPLPKGLSVVGLTQCLDPRDSLVLRPQDTLKSLPWGAKIATSSVRRENAVKKLRSDFYFIDVRGTIEKRLSLLDTGAADGVVIAEAALIRLKLKHINRIILNDESVPLQGRLAIVARSEDHAMRALFATLLRT